MAEQQAEPDEPKRPKGRAMTPAEKRRYAPIYHAKKSVRQLAHMVRCYALDRRRVRELVLMADRKSGDNYVREKSVPLRNDRPEIELILWRRDQVLKLETQIATWEERLNNASLPDADFAAALASLARIKATQMEHLQRMEDGLAGLDKQVGRREIIMSKMASDMAHLMQSETQHKDKMELAHKVAAVPSAAALKTKLAEKYGVTEEQVEKMLLDAPPPPQIGPERAP